jgi:hypothetical protein
MIDTSKIHETVTTGITLIQIIIPAILALIGFIGGHLHRIQIVKAQVKKLQKQSSEAKE